MYIKLDPKKKFGFTLNAIFATDIDKDLPLDQLEFTYSKKTCRIKHVIFNNKIIATLRTDGGFALTIDGAELLLKTNKIKENCIIVRNDVAEFIKEGRSVFCKHVIYAGSNIKANSDVIILDEDNNLLAVGKSVLPYNMIREFNRGVAAKVRHSVND
ncbi:MAG: hypothetical protein KatS3mg003_0103 [Candidatus Nitrosocaldaceae archaeon]|nr:MAG: hypothetical protein KatS3mg003_0103 [Candidatus Nitrosocaldaceae archaeon]